MQYTKDAPIGIIGAMDVEVDLLKAMMAEDGTLETAHIAGMDFAAGTLGNNAAVVVKCGVGMVNAGICAEVLIEHFKAAAVVNTGIAGSLDARIDIKDIVVATDAVNHIMDVANLGYTLGETPDLGTVGIPADAALREEILAAASALGMKAHTGRVASGDRFVRDAAEKERIVSTFGAKCCEMEGGAIAQACYLSRTPFAIVRAISDKADGSAAMDYPTFEKEAAQASARLIAALLGA